jgi:FHA domain
MTGALLFVLRLAMAISLYVFLGWGLLVLWRDLKRHSELLATRLAPPIGLAAQLVEGLKEYQFKGEEILIGREAACDVLLDDLTVSGKHARLAYHSSQWWVEDLQSRNGTYLNREPVISQVVLANGDELQVGQVIVQIAIGDR